MEDQTVKYHNKNKKFTGQAQQQKRDRGMNQ